jgi:hypothetical protein
MPRVAMDFSKTVIYHFVCKDEMIKCSYVGSTTNFVKRKNCHKSVCYNEKRHEYNLKLYQTIRENGGWINWDMKPLEEFPCENKTQQVIREQYWIDRLNPELNHCKAYQPLERKEYIKEYQRVNAEVIRDKQKEYQQVNAEVIAEKQKAYRETNAEAINVWREANKDKTKTYNKAYYEAKKKNGNV